MVIMIDYEERIGIKGVFFLARATLLALEVRTRWFGAM
jgi:hypothetical protein